MLRILHFPHLNVLRIKIKIRTNVVFNLSFSLNYNLNVFGKIKIKKNILLEKNKFTSNYFPKKIQHTIFVCVEKN